MKLENLPYIRKWAALMEVMHIASLAHDDIIDDSSSRRGQQTHHIKYGKRNAVFSGNFIISKASKAIYEFNNPDLFRIYSIAMDDLAGGQIIQILTKNSIGKFKYDKQNKSENKSLDAKINKVIQALQIYVHKSYYKTAALMSNALRAVPLFFSLSDFDETTRKQIQILCFRVGQHFGIGFQIVDDILDYTSTTQQMGKQAMSDLVGGNITGPVYLSLLSEYLMKKQDLKNLQNNANELLSVEKIEEILLKKKKNIEQVMKIKQWVIQRGGVQSSIQLAVQHIKKGLQYVQKLNNYLKSKNINQQQNKDCTEVWQYLGLKIIKRRS